MRSKLEAQIEDVTTVGQSRDRLPAESCRSSGSDREIASDASWPTSVRLSASSPSYFGLLRYLKGVVHLNAEVANGALKLGVAE